MSREDLGNIIYGYLGSAMGIGEITLFWGAGFAQKVGDKDFLEISEIWDSNANYGDDAIDQEYVKKGIQMCYEDYPNAKPGINRTLP